MRKFVKKSNVYGWMGKTHALLSVMLLCICLLVPINVFEETIWLLKDNILFFIVGLTCLVGGALLPDLDNCSSSAGWQDGRHSRKGQCCSRDRPYCHPWPWTSCQSSAGSTSWTARKHLSPSSDCHS